MINSIPVVDFFAGPGGLGEGFAAFEDASGRHPFQLALSVEKDPAAHRTLTLRAFARRFPKGELPGSYYDYISGRRSEPWDLASAAEWRDATDEAMHGSLGEDETDSRVRDRLASMKLRGRPWVLIGGPPCQAYSLVGRARNAGIRGYRPDRDERHLLYQQYLAVLHEYRPPVFVMENVKGILSSTLQGNRIFSKVLADLSEPSRSLGRQRNDSPRYRIRGLCEPVFLSNASEALDVDQNAFIVASEKLGIPQRRHRVILVGVLEGFAPRLDVLIATDHNEVRVRDAIGALPRLRSGLSEDGDNADRWRTIVKNAARRLVATVRRHGLVETIDQLESIVVADDSAFPSDRLSRRMPHARHRNVAADLHRWYSDPRLNTLANHETRAHMSSDLERYLFCAAFGRAYGRSPRASDFPARLAPDHVSWKQGAFADRFHVQLPDAVSSTITSHMAKDGHYFIHYDPFQCRTLTVREAARLQTFPDNYFFEGTRTQQYTQVGNAVPPLLARGIAKVVHSILRQ